MSKEMYAFNSKITERTKPNMKILWLHGFSVTVTGMHLLNIDSLR